MTATQAFAIFGALALPTGASATWMIRLTLRDDLRALNAIAVTSFLMGLMAAFGMQAGILALT